jgi:chromosome segregation ATPase
MSEKNQEIQERPQGPDALPTQVHYTAFEMELSKRISDAEKVTAVLMARQERFATKNDVEAAKKEVVAELTDRIEDTKSIFRVESGALKSEIVSHGKRTGHLTSLFSIVIIALLTLCGLVLSLSFKVADITIQISGITTQMSDFKTQMSDITTQMSDIEKRLSGQDAKIQAILDTLQALPSLVAAPSMLPPGSPPGKSDQSPPGNADF